MMEWDSETGAVVSQQNISHDEVLLMPWTIENMEDCVKDAKVWQGRLRSRVGACPIYK